MHLSYLLLLYCNGVYSTGHGQFFFLFSFFSFFNPLVIVFIDRSIDLSSPLLPSALDTPFFLSQPIIGTLNRNSELN